MLLWQVEGRPSVAFTDEGDLRSAVESVAGRTPLRPEASCPLPPSDFLRLEEEQGVAALRARVRRIAPCLRPGEQEEWERRLAPGVLPRGRILAIARELGRIESRGTRFELQRDFENRVLAASSPERPTVLRALLLFSRDGRLLVSDGSASSLDVVALSARIARGEPGTTWRFTHRSWVLVGHIGERTALVAVFVGRPKPVAGGTLRVSVASLEKRDRLASAMGHPSGHAALKAYVRAVRILLERNA